MKRPLDDVVAFQYLKSDCELPIWDETTFEWNVKWSQLGKDVYSPEFTCAESKWKCNVCLDDEIVPKCVSVYLSSVDATSNPHLGWHRILEYVVAMVNTKNHAVGVYSKLSEAREEFNVHDNSYGQPNLIELSKLESMEIIQDDTVTLIVELRVFKDDYTRPLIPAQRLAAEATALASKTAELGYSHIWIETAFRVTYGQAIDFATPSSDLESYIDCPVLADVELVLNVNAFYGVIQKSFFAHKNTLAATSKFFEAMFNDQSGFNEATEFTVKIELPVALSSAEFMRILEYFYVGKLGVFRDEISRSGVSTNPSLLRWIMVAEYLQMETLLEYLTTEIHELDPWLFRSQVGWMNDTVFPYAVLSSLFNLSKDHENPLRKMLEWLDLTLSSPDSPHGWDTTQHGLKHLNQVIESHIIPRVKELPFNRLHGTLLGLSDKLLSYLRLDVIVLPAILSHLASQ